MYDETGYAPAISGEMNGFPIESETLPACDRLLALYRRRAEKVTSPGLFGDPAWIILLTLHAARLRGEPLSTGEALANAGCSTAAGQRWLAVLVSEGLAVRSAATVSISVAGSRQVAEILEALGR